MSIEPSRTTFQCASTLNFQKAIMSDGAPKYRPEIIEAIEGLRVRKTRPDGPRIASYCFKNFNIPMSEVKADLERLVEHDAVLKVEYKGSISYRDSEKWIHAAASNAMIPLAVQFGHLQNSIMTTDRIMSAVISLSDNLAKILPQNPRKPVGISLPLETIERKLVALYPGTILRGDKLKKSILREVDCGRMVELMNGCFVLTGRVEKSMKIRREAVRQMPKKSPEPASAGKKSPKQSKRPTKFIKEAVKCEVKEDAQEEPKPKRLHRKINGSAIGHAKLDMAMRKRPSRHCLECFEEKGITLARVGVLLECVGCSYAAHPECGGYSNETVEFQKGNYKCMQCKHCKICDTGKLGEDKNLIVCVRCDNAFHLACHTPSVTLEGAAKVEWKCEDCVVAGRVAKRKRLHSDELEPDAAPPVTTEGMAFGVEVGREVKEPNWSAFNGFPIPGNQEKTAYDGLNNSDVIQDAMEAWRLNRPPKKTQEMELKVLTWTVEEVVQKFEERGFPAAAELMRKQVIDGFALSLLTRDDVITKFGLRFVVALRLFREICQVCPFGPFSEY